MVLGERTYGICSIMMPLEIHNITFYVRIKNNNVEHDNCKVFFDKYGDIFSCEDMSSCNNIGKWVKN